MQNRRSNDFLERIVLELVEGYRQVRQEFMGLATRYYHFLERVEEMRQISAEQDEATQIPEIQAREALYGKLWD